MKPVKNWESVKEATDRQVLPKGGYVCRILDAKEVTYNGKNGDFSKLEIAIDISEGEYKDFYQNDFAMNPNVDKKWRGVYRIYCPKDDGSKQDEWTKSKFKAMTHAIEDSNAGYHWDWNEKGLKGKRVGAIFRSEEWEKDGRTGWATRCFKFVPIDSIREGKYKIPDDLPLKKETAPVNTNDFEEVEVDDQELPF